MKNTGNRAPHEPLLLLSVLDSFERGGVEPNLIQLTPELGESFNRCWTKVLPLDRRGNLALPFFRLSLS